MQDCVTFVSEFVEAGLDKDSAAELNEKVSNILQSENPASEQWRQISKNLLTPQTPFPIHQLLFSKVYSGSISSDKNNDNNEEKKNNLEPNYIWIPTKEEIEPTNLYKLIKKTNHNNLKEFFNWSDKNREKFWNLLTTELNIKFKEKPQNFKIFDITTNNDGIAAPIYYPNCKMNAVDSLLQGNDDDTAIIYVYESEYTNELNNNKIPKLNKITIGELTKEVNRIANGLRNENKLNLNIGDSIAIDMPMNWESVAIYLGIIKAGLIVVSIADSFAPHAIDIRLKISNTKAIFTQDIIPRGNKKIQLYERILKCDKPSTIIVIPADYKEKKLDVKLRQGDMSYNDFLSDMSDEFDSESMDSMTIANILFSSGTTGEPKAIPWHHSTFLKPLSDGYLHNDIQSNEVIAWPTNVGWMMGPWLISQIGLGAKIALFVGSPISKSFCKFVEQSKIAHLGVIPSMVKAWMRQDATKDCNWKNVRRFSSTGEASNPALYHWLVSRAYYSPVMEYVGGTEIAGGYLGGTMIQPQLLSSFSCVCFGLNIYVIDHTTGEPVNLQDGINEGELTIVPPSIGLSVTLLNKDKDHFQVYYANMPNAPDDGSGIKRILRRHGDELRILSNGYYQHLGRCDDTMNLGGIKISSIELENTITKHPLLSRECAAIAYRQNEVDSENLVICAVPKNPRDTFIVNFDKRPLGLVLAPAKSNPQRVLVLNVSESKENENNLSDYSDLKGSIVYKINEHVVYNKQFKDVIKLINNHKLPFQIQFIRKNFDIETIRNELHNLVKKHLNPLFKVHDVFVVDKLPRTASGKVMRRIIRSDYSKAYN